MCPHHPSACISSIYLPMSLLSHHLLNPHRTNLDPLDHHAHPPDQTQRTTPSTTTPFSRPSHNKTTPTLLTCSTASQGALSGILHRALLMQRISSKTLSYACTKRPHQANCLPRVIRTAFSLGSCSTRRIVSMAKTKSIGNTR